MKKLIKYVFALLLLLFLIVAGALIFINPNDYKAELSKVATENLGVNVDFSGDLSWQLIPSLGLKAGGIRIDNPEEFSDKAMVDIENIGFSMALMPLFSKQIEVQSILLDGVQVNLVKNKLGIGNWEALFQGSKTKDDKENSESTEQKLSLESIQLSHLELSYQDQQTGETYQVSKGKVSLADFTSGKQAKLALSASIGGMYDAEVSLSTQLESYDDFSRTVIKGLKFRVNSSAIPGQSLSGKGDLTINSGQNLGVDIDRLDLDVLDGKIKLAGQYTDSKVNLTLDGETLAMGKLKDQVPAIHMEQLSPMDFLFSINGKPNSLLIKSSHFNSGIIEGQLNAQLADSIMLDLKVKQLDLDKLLVEQDEVEPAKSSDELINTQMLPGQKARIKIQFDELIASKLKFSQVNTEVDIKQSHINARLSSDFYQGQIKFNADFKARDQKVLLSSQGEVSNIEIEPMQKDLLDDAWVKGKGQIAWDVKSYNLSTLKDLKQTLKGAAQIKLENGAILGVNVAELIRQSYALFKGQEQEKSTEPNETDFSDLSASVQFLDGVVSNNDLLMQSPLLRIVGEGDVNLVEEKLDYHVKPVLVASLTGQNGEKLEELAGIPIPIHVKGSFDKPDYAIDWVKLLTNTQKKKVEKKLKKELLNLFGGKKDKKKDKQEPKEGGS
ncbi:MAG: AsmA family protein [bacterium]